MLKKLQKDYRYLKLSPTEQKDMEIFADMLWDMIMPMDCGICGFLLVDIIDDEPGLICKMCSEEIQN